jgi:hypothetical protein
MATKYMPCCLVCYTCNLAPKPVGKKEANMLAVSHQNAYGHDVTILEKE